MQQICSVVLQWQDGRSLKQSRENAAFCQILHAPSCLVKDQMSGRGPVGLENLALVFGVGKTGIACAVELTYEHSYLIFSFQRNFRNDDGRRYGAAGALHGGGARHASPA